jgi:hypothetical protein
MRVTVRHHDQIARFELARRLALQLDPAGSCFAPGINIGANSRESGAHTDQGVENSPTNSTAPESLTARRTSESVSIRCAMGDYRPAFRASKSAFQSFTLKRQA